MAQDSNVVAALTWKLVAVWLIGCGALVLALGISDGISKHGFCLSHCTTVLKIVGQ